jgi:hypothetical protein
MHTSQAPSRPPPVARNADVDTESLPAPLPLPPAPALAPAPPVPSALLAALLRLLKLL